MDMHLIVDIAHTIALVSLAVFCASTNRDLKILVKYVSTVGRNPAKARRISFEKFKNDKKQQD